MNIAVLGAGAMGRLFAAGLSRRHDVLLMDRNEERVRQINERGITVTEQSGETHTFYPRAALMGSRQRPVDLVVVFVKAMGTQQALERCQSLIGEDTLLLTLQNGGGHEEVLSRYAPMERVLIGTTQHNASIREDGAVFHGGSGHTVIGCPLGKSEAAGTAAQAFCEAGFDAQESDNVKQAVWTKLMTNVSLSALTGVFQMPMGFVTQSESCWALCDMLIREAVAVADADGVHFDAEKKIAEVRAVSENGPMGVTSICADLMNGRRTEVDTISGSVVRAAKRLGIPAPCHTMMVQLIHAMEDKNDVKKTL